MARNIKVAITGGPSGGKTTLIEALKKEYPSGQVKIVPEAASILYKGGFPRVKSYEGLFHAQRAIYAVQREVEDLRCKIYPQAVIVCDRGSIDALAYWPDGAENFFSVVGSTIEKEIARYDWVIHLDTAAEPDYDNSNAIRTENFQEALALNEKIKKSWSVHPQRLVINSHQDFLSKVGKATLIIKAIMESKRFEEVRKLTEQ
jgi:predicted ATPase